MQQNLCQFFLPWEAEAFWNNMEKEPQKPRPKLKKYVYYIFTKNFCSACNPIQGEFLYKNLLILQNHHSNFLEGTKHNTSRAKKTFSIAKAGWIFSWFTWNP